MTDTTDIARVAADILEPRSTDDEASAILDELSRLQSWCVMQHQTPGAMQAADLVQRTRILIIERCKRPSLLAREAAERGGEGDAPNTRMEDI